MKYYSGRQGFVKGLFLLVFIAALVYAGIAIGKPYYRYNTLRSHTKDLLQMELITNIDTLTRRIMEDATELKIPLEEKNIDVKVVNKIITVKARWYEIVDFLGYYQKRIDFVMEVEY